MEQKTINLLGYALAQAVLRQKKNAPYTDALEGGLNMIQEPQPKNPIDMVADLNHDSQHYEDV